MAKKPQGSARVWLGDCVEQSHERLKDNSVDLIVTDPPYGIDGDKLDKHYNRDESFVIPGYVEVPKNDYAAFSSRWISEAARVLRPNGSMYIVSGWTNLKDILAACDSAGLRCVNHIIWQFNFGVYTTRKFVSGHYHILLLTKPGKGKKHKPFVFNRPAGLSNKEFYQDAQDVWRIPREYRPGQAKNKNQLPEALVEKMIGYSSNHGDVVCDFFMGGFTTARVAVRMGREAVGFEMNPNAYEKFIGEFGGRP